MIPTKEEFKHYMDYIIQKEEADCKINDIITSYTNVFADGIWPMDVGVGLIVELLEKIFELPLDEKYGSTLTWWLYEKDFGKDFEVGDLEYANMPEDHKLRKPDLSTLDGLYDCLVLEWNAGNNVVKKYA